MIEFLNLNFAVRYSGFASLDDFFKGLQFSVKAAESGLFFPKSLFSFLVTGLWQRQFNAAELME